MKSGKDGNCAGDPENTSTKKRATNRGKKKLSYHLSQKTNKKRKRKEKGESQLALQMMMRDLTMETKGMSINELLKAYLCKCSLKL